jgi:hypothetical protein
MEGAGDVAALLGLRGFGIEKLFLSTLHHHQMCRGKSIASCRIRTISTTS